MPTENKPAEPDFNLNTPDGGRSYIAHLFKTVLRRHDYRHYIAEQLAGDFACTLAQHFEDIRDREQALQLRLNAADQRIDELTVQLSALLPPRKPQHATAPDNDMRTRLECKNKGYNEALDDVARLITSQ